MIPIVRVLLALLVGLGSWVQPSLVGAQPASEESSKAQHREERGPQAMLQKALASVVQVLSERGRNAERGEGSRSFDHFFDSGSSTLERLQGSGFMIDEPGLVLTNAHVVQGGMRFHVRLRHGREIDAQLVGMDRGSDLALLRIDRQHWLPLPWAESGDYGVGSPVFAVGSPLGMGSTVTQGIVSGLGRPAPGSDDNVYIQTDAVLSTGSSGGPLIDSSGRVLGINSWVWGSGLNAGFSFALPSDLARPVVRRILRDARRGARPSPWLGMVPWRAESGLDGIAVQHVFEGGAAHAAGIRGGERLLSMDGEALTSVAKLRILLSLHDATDVIWLRSDRRPEPFAVSLGARPAELSSRQWSQRFSGGLGEMSHEATVAKALSGRSCPGPCGNSLMNCYGCSTAKGEWSHAHQLSRQGAGPEEIRRHLDAPVQTLVWFDYLDGQSRELLRHMEGLSQELGPLLRVHLRYLPANASSRVGWRRCVQAVEAARWQGLHAEAHEWLLAEDGLGWQEKVALLPRQMSLDGQDYWRSLGNGHFSQQIEDDLLTARESLRLDSSPQLMIDGELWRASLDLPFLTELILQRILEASL